MSHSHFDGPDERATVVKPGVQLSGQLSDFQPGARVRLRITVMQDSTGAIAKIDKMVTLDDSRTSEVTADELSRGLVPDLEFNDAPVVATAQASVQWGKELELRRATTGGPSDAADGTGITR